MRIRAVDILIAVAATAATAYPNVVWGSTGDVALSVLASAPLLWRRRAPVLVALVCGIGTTWLSIVQRLPDLPYGQLVATYTWAELATPRWRWTAGVGTAAGIAVSLILPHENPPSFGYVGMTFVTAYALGTGVRARRDRIAFLEERTRRLTEEQAAAAGAERARIARDMHDVLAHSVGLMVVQAEGGASVVHADAARAEAAFDAIADTGREALVQLRHALGVLRDREPDAPGLDAVASLVERARRTGLSVTLTRAAVPPVGAEVGATAFRVVQEALTNAVKHAGARHVAVVLAAEGRSLRVQVRDDGRGASPGSAGHGTAGPGSAGHGTAGHGLAGMAERVAAVGGTLRTGPPALGPGFEVSALLPAGQVPA